MENPKFIIVLVRSDNSYIILCELFKEVTLKEFKSH